MVPCLCCKFAMAKSLTFQVTYRHEPIITINPEAQEKLSIEERQQIVKSCPSGVYKCVAFGTLSHP